MDPFGQIALEALSADGLPSPCYVINEVAVERNLRILDSVQKASGAKVILALKAFATWPLFPLVRKYLCGIAASSICEARLGRELFGGEVHVYAPAYADHEIDEFLARADHITFNSLSQWRRFRQRVEACAVPPRCGLRINPEHSEVSAAIYDPCAPGSRLGVTSAQLAAAGDEALAGLSGLHFHTLCQANADALERTLTAVVDRFGFVLSNVDWVNFGGGHHISRDDYDVDRLNALVRDFSRAHNVQVLMEPGEAVGFNSGVLVATVLDVVHNGGDIAMLDTSAAAHMPDVLEMPYRPPVFGSGEPGEKPYTYRLGGPTCLAGDVIGDYSFDVPLTVGQRLVFGDMAHYTMVKNNTFNGVTLPAIAIHNSDEGDTRVLRRFGYDDYKTRLG